MKKIEVVAAIIKNDKRVLATKRGYGEFIDMWEFPGGKIEPAESREDALKREIAEELKVDIGIDDFLCTVSYDYPNFHLTMHCYICSILDGKITLVEHKDARWLPLNQLDSVEWLPADIEVVENIKAYLKKFYNLTKL
ncbi:MAG TPA: (deoxy)nucleoside triphosphate pyrophosphohydrolase [Clostridiales bacterium]|nr:(deoxy)nucleoside triphosphate pyrophosphohydrolase [Clostridiales bacterium]